MGKSTSSYKPQKRADGRWAIRLMVDGESVYIYGKTQSEVRDRLKTKLKEIEDAKSAKITDVLKADKITVEQWARTCLETYSSVGVRNSTYGGYLSIINTHLSDRFGKMKLSEVTNACVQDFISKKARSKANPITRIIIKYTNASNCIQLPVRYNPKNSTYNNTEYIGPSKHK